MDLLRHFKTQCFPFNDHKLHWLCCGNHLHHRLHRLCSQESSGRSRIHVIGWSCVVTSAAVFAAPLSIMRSVIHTKSVEFMPFTLSFFLTCSAILWLVYGLLLKDFYISLPNIVGVVLGTIQMLLYVVYKKFNNNIAKDHERKQPSPIVNGKNINHIKASNIHSSSPQVSGDIEVGRDENLYGPQLEHSDDGV
uniref:Bidirectional sugar transporter SWEET n=1 Tax=Gossypium raimondii TaxID=29730 RepID=A0A0D2PM75_GOSRA|nr:hypothetical protein B456_001G055500 [Gossypium raimondii]